MGITIAETSVPPPPLTISIIFDLPLDKSDLMLILLLVDTTLLIYDHYNTIV